MLKNNGIFFCLFFVVLFGASKNLMAFQGNDFNQNILEKDQRLNQLKLYIKDLEEKRNMNRTITQGAYLCWSALSNKKDEESLSKIAHLKEMIRSLKGDLEVIQKKINLATNIINPTEFPILPNGIQINPLNEPQN